MGCGSWTSSSFKDYAVKCSFSVDSKTGEIADDCSVQELYLPFPFLLPRFSMPS